MRLLLCVVLLFSGCHSSEIRALKEKQLTNEAVHDDLVALVNGQCSSLRTMVYALLKDQKDLKEYARFLEDEQDDLSDNIDDLKATLKEIKDGQPLIELVEDCPKCEPPAPQGWGGCMPMLGPWPPGMGND